MIVKMSFPVAVLVSAPRFKMQRSAPFAFMRSEIWSKCCVERANRSSLVTMSDGIARVYGLDKVQAGEMHRK
jgi:hypothetical protein